MFRKGFGVLDALAGLPGSVATDTRWLTRQIEQLAAAWGVAHEPGRFAGTLWWSMSVYSLFSAPIDAMVAGVAVPDPTPERVRFSLSPEGAIGSVRHDATLTHIGPAFRATMEAIITPVAKVSGAGPRSLWAIASDALANRALEMSDYDTALMVANRVADEIGPDLPRPRFTLVGERAFVRRSSCCLYYASPLADGKCTSCPRRTPAERCSLLAALV